jgi:DNA-directed RNA polymerase alpha subunit
MGDTRVLYEDDIAHRLKIKNLNNRLLDVDCQTVKYKACYKSNQAGKCHRFDD